MWNAETNLTGNNDHTKNITLSDRIKIENGKNIRNTLTNPRFVFKVFREETDSKVGIKRLENE